MDNSNSNSNNNNDDGDDGDDDARRATTAAVVWSTAADARLWAASIRGMAARTEYRKACEAEVRATQSAIQAMEENKGAVGARNRLDAEAIRRAAAEFGDAAEAMAQAAAALDKTSGLGRLEADDYELAAEAYARAASVEREREARKSASAALRLALTAAKQLVDTAADASGFRRLANRWAANAAKWSRESYEVVGGRDEHDANWASMISDFELGMTKSAELAEAAAAKEGEAVRGLQNAAAAAKHAAAAVAVVEAERGQSGQGMQEAVAAWKEAVSAASKAEDGAAGRTG